MVVASYLFLDRRKQVPKEATPKEGEKEKYTGKADSFIKLKTFPIITKPQEDILSPLSYCHCSIKFRRALSYYLRSFLTSIAASIILYTRHNIDSLINITACAHGKSSWIFEPEMDNCPASKPSKP